MLLPNDVSPVQVTSGGRLVAKFGQRNWRAWKLDVGDVDGDGRPDLAVGVNKATLNNPKRHTSLFVLSFDGKEITKKWLGSTMGRPLLDFCIGHLAKSAQPLFTLERTLKGRIALSRWKWSGFGFEKVREEGEWKTARNLRAVGDNIELRVNGNTVSFPSRMK